jgi:hypothetical protein
VAPAPDLQGSQAVVISQVGSSIGLDVNMQHVIFYGYELLYVSRQAPIVFVLTDFRCEMQGHVSTIQDSKCCVLTLCMILSFHKMR